MKRERIERRVRRRRRRPEIGNRLCACGYVRLLWCGARSEPPMLLLARLWSFLRRPLPS